MIGGNGILSCTYTHTHTRIQPSPSFFTRLLAARFSKSPGNTQASFTAQLSVTIVCDRSGGPRTLFVPHFPATQHPLLPVPTLRNERARYSSIFSLCQQHCKGTWVIKILVSDLPLPAHDFDKCVLCWSLHQIFCAYTRMTKRTQVIMNTCVNPHSSCWHSPLVQSRFVDLNINVKKFNKLIIYAYIAYRIDYLVM